ncbi:MAG: DUF4304 domain-containing protein [Candidatus Nucleicultricaceae bacterium]
MNSVMVNKAIRKYVWPLLRENNFTESTTRTFWRFKENRIEVINFQSFNSYLAEGLKCTTFSFAINLGIYLPYIPSYPTMKNKDGKILPKEFECHLRKCLIKSLEQQELERKDIWYINSDGMNLSKVMEDAHKMISENGFKWFSEFQDNKTLLDFLLTKDENNTFGMGNNPSPQRSLLIGFAAAELGNWERAKVEFEKVIQSGCFEHLHEFISAKLET